MNKFLAVTFIYFLSISLGVGIMVYGWGLQPVSWWWIIGGGVVGRIMIETMYQVGKRE